MADQAELKRLELVRFLPTTLPSIIEGDHGRLRQILFNLIGNAIPFTDQRGIFRPVTADGHARTVVEGCQATSTPPNPIPHGSPTLMIRFEVTDTGMGIEPDFQSNLFHSFSQNNNSTTREYGGTGLELAISKQLVELMGGYIGVGTTPGAGWIPKP